MIIKKFVGKTETEAIEIAKKELGNDVVIMNVKNVKNKGLFSMFQKKMIEVTAAREEETERFNTFQSTENIVKNSAYVNATPKSSYETEGHSSIVDGAKNIEEKLETLQNLLVSQLSKPNFESEKIKEEYSDEKKSISKDNEVDEKSEKDNENTKFMKLLYNTMIENEVDEKYANVILEEVDKIQKPNMPFDHLLASIYQRIILKFGKTESISPAQNGSKVILFLGSTGVGKTTTIAKIASQFSVSGKKIAMLTADTYRIAAAEQLRTYANILHVPFRVIYTKEEMISAIKAFYEFDYIFIDTAGHSYQNEEQISQMKEMIESIATIAESQIYLVLSATTKYKDLIKIADSYKAISDFQMIFTKLDETSSLGNLLNLKMHTDSSIAYVTYGQNVPDDIEVFNPQKTVKLLLGGKKK